ncbi:MAG: DMT family transporter [Acidobacteria bacterium]|jgi:drug/metabolite transporter (DMT)-like permease|nr:DMT family transporter [Acidobacteriota bacterium]
MSSQSAGVAWRVHVGLLFVQLTFGAFHVVAKAVLAYLHPLALAGLRVLVATPLLLLLAWQHDRILPGRRDLPWLALLGLLGVFANQLLFILGLRLTTATSAALLMPSIPVFAAAVAIIGRIERASAGRALGIALSVLGALVMLDPRSFRMADRALAGDLLVLANCMSYATFLVVMRPVLRRLPVATVIAWSFLFGGAGVTAVSWPHLIDLNLAAAPLAVWAGVAYVVLVPTTLNYLINAWAVARSTPSLVAAYTTLQPLSAGLLAALFLAERPGWPQLAGGLLIAAGLWRVSAATPGKRVKAPARA